MSYYTETVEAAQFVKGNGNTMKLIDLVERAGFANDWQLSSDGFRVGCDGYDGYKFYLSKGDWLVLRDDKTLQIVPDTEFQRRYSSMPQAVEAS
jgi:hypothetical protein